MFLGKKKDRDATTKEIVGNIIKCTTFKSRLSKENQKAEVLLSYDKGLDRYYGMIELAIEAGLFEKKGSRIVANDKSVYAKQILADPEQYFTEDVMAKLDVFAKERYSYGTGSEMAPENINTEESA